MQSHMSSGYVGPVLIDKYLNVEQAAGKMSLFEALVQGGAIFRDEGIRLHVYPQLLEYKVTMVWKNGGLYEGTARLSRLYKFLVQLGIPASTGWEVFYV